MAAAAGQIQPLKIPDAVVALAQAAAKANGDTEKYLPGWPLFSPPKMQLAKCGKCPREFCSYLALRRHSRVHRQKALKIHKDFPKNRDHVAAFWDKLTVDQARTILSLENVEIERIKGSAILTALSSWMCKPGYASLPLAYARAGNELLDLIQTAASRLPISSNELFGMLDEASENTFLCTNAADVACVQKYLFDGEAEKVVTELKNVVTCASYILEQKLVEAWSVDKAAEALRCQKLLVEEEDAAQKRQAEIMERKRMKKRRQKEQRSKDLKDEDAMVQSPEMADGARGSPGIQSLEAVSSPGLCEQEEYLRLPAPMPSDDKGFSPEDTICDSSLETDAGAGFREQTVSISNLDKLENVLQTGIASGSMATSKHPSSVRHTRQRDPNVNAVSNRSKTWAWKVRTDTEERRPKAELDADGSHETVLNTDKNTQLLIGSISVAIKDNAGKRLQDSHPVVEARQPMSPNRNEREGTDGGNKIPAAEDHSPPSVVTDESGLNCCDEELAAVGGDSCGTGFSSKEASAFLSRRWEKAIAGDHVKLVLCSEN